VTPRAATPWLSRWRDHTVDDEITTGTLPLFRWPLTPATRLRPHFWKQRRRGDRLPTNGNGDRDGRNDLPNAFAANTRDETKILRSRPGSSNVTVINGRDDRLRRLSSGLVPNSVAVNPVTTRIYVANRRQQQRDGDDGATNGTATVSVGTPPFSGGVNPGTTRSTSSNRNRPTDGGSTVRTNATATVFRRDEIRFSRCREPGARTRFSVREPGQHDFTVIDGATNTRRRSPWGRVPNSVCREPGHDDLRSRTATAGQLDREQRATNAINGVLRGNFRLRRRETAVVNKIYVTNFAQRDRDDGSTDTVEATVPVGTTNSSAVALKPVTNKIYVADETASPESDRRRDEYDGDCLCGHLRLLSVTP